MNKIPTLLALALNFSLFAQPGALDTTFNPGMGANQEVYSIAQQSDKKIIITGDFTSYNGTGRSRIARLNTNGSLDASFDPSAGANDVIHATAIQSDGKIIVGGNFTGYNSTSLNYIARLNTSGTVDATYNPGLQLNGIVGTIAIQSDGKIIIGGHFSAYSTTPRNYIARLNTDGTLDATFNPGTGADLPPRALAIQSNGKIIVGGDFTTYNGIVRNHIARLNMNGSLDTTFNPGTGADGAVLSTNLQSDGKIIITGSFTKYNGTPREYIARLNTDGTLDATFNASTLATSPVYANAIQSNGKIIIAGGPNDIARLNTDGSIDASFNAGTGPNGFVGVITLQSDGKIMIGGFFNNYNGTSRNYVARVLANNVGVGIQEINTTDFTFSMYPNPTTNNTTLLFDAAENSQLEVMIINALGEKVIAPFIKTVSTGKQQIDIATESIPNGIYYVQLKSNATIVTKPLVVQH